jgi:hypothetical protein
MIGYGRWRYWKIEQRCAGPIKVRGFPKPRGVLWHSKWEVPDKGPRQIMMVAQPPRTNGRSEAMHLDCYSQIAECQRRIRFGRILQTFWGATFIIAAFIIWARLDEGTTPPFGVYVMLAGSLVTFALATYSRRINRRTIEKLRGNLRES